MSSPSRSTIRRIFLLVWRVASFGREQHRNPEVRHSLGFPADFAGSETAALVSHLLILLLPGSPTTPATRGIALLERVDGVANVAQVSENLYG